ncbi:MAG: amidohydrolase [Negativicutes bacterium]
MPYDVNTSIVFINANIRTLDPALPRAQALIAKNGVLLAAGSNQDIRDIADREMPGVKILDLKGRTVLPGFIDAHTHLLAGGFALQAVDLRGCSGPDEFVRRITERARTTQPGGWVKGGGWDQEPWPAAPLPHKDWIDAVTGNIPVFVTRSDLHIGLANSAALQAAGITAGTPDPTGGEIYRDSATGEPTGILKDAAIRLLDAAMPKPTPTEQAGAVRLALRQAASRGVTSVQDITDWGNPTWSEWNLFQEFRRQGELTCRIYARLPLIDWDRRRDDLPRFQTGPAADPWLRFGGLKGFTDGSLGGRTAYFFDPYADAPDYCGLLQEEMLPEGTMERRIREADLSGIPVSVHAIGDRANSILLDIFAGVVRSNGPRDRRLRIEHAQHLRKEDIQRMAQLGIIASIQPAHIIDDGGWAERRIGPERCRLTYAFHSLAAAGVRLAGGSDWPVAPLDPLLGIQAAVTRCTSDGLFPDGWHPEQQLTVDQAIHAFTLDAAFAEFAEAEKGSLLPGKFADCVVLSEDPYDVSAATFKEIRVLATIAGGSVVYEEF